MWYHGSGTRRDGTEDTDTLMGRGVVLFFIACVCFSLATFADLGYTIFMMLSCIVCSVYVPFVRIYAFTIVTETCLPPADRHIGLGLSPNSTGVTSRHDTTRSTCRAHAFWLCRACRTARLDTLETTSPTGATRNLVCCLICIKL